MVRFFLIFFLSFVHLTSGCARKKQEQSVIIDFSQSKLQTDSLHAKDTIPPLKVAIAAIISPKESFIYYEEMMAYISGQIKRPIQYIQKKTYSEINELIIGGQIDLAFICTGAYTEPRARAKMEILVVPEVKGETFYQSYIITHKNSGINSFSELRNRSFAYTDPMSNSGYYYPLRRLKDFGSPDNVFFSRTLFTHAHDYSIQMVARRIVDAAAVDGLIFEYYVKFHPERVKDIIIIEKSEKFGIPPVVVPKTIDWVLKQQLKTIFLNLHTHKQGQAILSNLMIDRFVHGQEENYMDVIVLP